MKENYTLYLSSQNTTNRTGTTKKSLQYYINWHAILPKAENINQKFLVKFKFVGYIQGSFGEIYNLQIDFGGSNMYDQSNSKSTYLGIMFPEDNATAIALTSGTGGNVSYFYLVSDPNDNLPVTIEYPNNNLITVSINNINTGSGTTFTNDYNLILEFVPIH